MNREDLRDLWRRDVDDVAVPYLWSDADFNLWINEAVDEACVRARLIQDSTSAICTIALADATAHYTLDASIFVVKSARIAAPARKLQILTRGQLDAHDADWEARTGDTPEAVLFDMNTGKITVYPIPTGVLSLKLTVWRSTTEAEQMGDDVDEPAIARQFHTDLLHWVSKRAYERKDSETYDPERSKDHEAQFTRKFGDRPSAHALKHMASNRRRETKAQWF